VKELTAWPDLLLKDYQGILQDTSFLSDEIDAIEARVIQNEADILELQADVVDLQLRVAALEYRAYEIVQTTTSLTTGPFETIICKNTALINITLDPDAKENDEVNIKRRGAEINVIGLIDGLTNITINANLYSMKLVFDGADWSEI
jgi:hypothetical protein